MRKMWMITFATILFVGSSLAAKDITGIVFVDSNQNLKLDSNEKGIPGVLVSNQQDVVKTDENGKFKIRITEETIIFITKPAGYMTPISADKLPRFYYIHQPKGSPELKYGGIQATGKLPKQLHFPLFKTADSDTFDIIAFSDPQTRNDHEIDYVRDDVVAELIGTKAVCGITLGDIMYDDLSHYGRYNAVVSQIGIPFYNVPGNHDENYDTPDDRYSLETFKRHFGPNYYSFDYGKVHFVALDVVDYLGKNEKGQSHYQGRIGEKQLQWLKNDLSFVPDDRLIVLTMHIPLFTSYGDEASINVVDRKDLFDVLKNRANILALAGHMHTLEHNFIGMELGWKGAKPIHQVICAAVCGTWWTGPKDERGIPIADQRDGSPNGYHIFTFEGNQYREILKPAKFSADFQLRISNPVGTMAQQEIGQQAIVVNVFDGSEKSIVMCQVDDSDFVPMQKTLLKDPFYEKIYEQIKNEAPKWITPENSTHIWTLPLPADLKPGVHKIVAKTIDQFGNEYKAAGVFEVE
ncbi:calcineurin-like phosphoesterase C-terminal domain-containing protein [candidate division KSB1 bacterium]|nr:calcineurin-like phosphoesterase C-terminal domain-containing protein [candidate division KSB1 bacterium]